MTTDKLSDADIAAVIFMCDERASWGEIDAGPNGRWDLAAQAIRQLLKENRHLRERLEPCRHEEVEKAGADWWRCTLCDTYIDTAALDAREGA